MIFALILIHTALSFIALGLGILAVRHFFKPVSPIWTKQFLIFAWATTLTGFILPFSGITPAVATGIVSTLVLIVVYLADQKFHQAGKWRAVYIASIVTSEFFLVFVTIAQAFLKIPALHALAPTGSEPPFGIAQLINLAVFAYIGFKAIRRQNSTI